MSSSWMVVLRCLQTETVTRVVLMNACAAAEIAEGLMEEFEEKAEEEREQTQQDLSKVCRWTQAAAFPAFTQHDAPTRGSTATCRLL